MSWTGQVLAAALLLQTVVASAAPTDDLSAGSAAIDQRDWGAAIEQLTRAIDSGALPPKDLAVAYDGRCVAWIHKGQFDQAIDDCNKAVGLDPASSRTYADRGIAWTQKGDPDRAIDDLNHAIALDPHNVDAFMHRGSAFFEAGKLDDATADFSSAIALDPKNGQAYGGRGMAQLHERHYDQAIADLTQAIAFQNEKSLPYYLRGCAWKDKGDYDRAIADYTQSIAIEMYNPRAYAARGDAWFEKGDYAKAMHDYRGATGMSIEPAEYYRGTAYAEFFAGSFTEAVLDFGQVLQRKPGDAYAALWQILSHWRRGDKYSDDLAKHARTIDTAPWPGAVVRYYLNEIGGDEVLTAADDPDPEKRNEQRCEAYFYLAEEALRDGHADEARRLFQASIDTGVESFYEYKAAQAELGRLPN